MHSRIIGERALRRRDPAVRDVGVVRGREGGHEPRRGQVRGDGGQGLAVGDKVIK
jgi:hypothetical protein